VVLTLIADTLYTMLARRLREFEECNASKLYRHFADGKGTVAADNSHVGTFPRRAHNPILRSVSWAKLPLTLPGPLEADLSLRFS
jgi:hypothetical protein